MAKRYNTSARVRSPTGDYECVACGFRARSETRLLACPDCDATLANVAVPRE